MNRTLQSSTENMTDPAPQTSFYIAMTSRTNVGHKAASLPRWFADIEKPHIECQYQEISEGEIRTHLLGWNRLGVDDGNIWRFPATEFCTLRLSIEEIKSFFPAPSTIVEALRATDAQYI